MANQRLTVTVRIQQEKQWRNIIWNFVKNAVHFSKAIKVNSGKQAMVMMACTKCGQKTRGLDVTRKVIEHSPKQFVAIIGKEEQELSTLPTIRIECPKCGNNTANVWQVQTRGSDESSTQFLRCLRCGFTYREST